MFKKVFTFFCLLLLCAQFQTVLAVDNSQIAQSATGINVTIYRLFNTETGEHLYTTSQVEVNVLTEGEIWVDENIAWYAPREITDDCEPVYRLFSRITGAHLYTTDENEVETLTEDKLWVIDFDGEPIFYSQGTTPIYRLYDTNTMIHLLTTDPNEYKILSNTEGWDAEGIALYATDKIFIQKYPLKNVNINNTKSDYAIEADVKFSGSGTGYHAKIVIQTPESAVSFGPQFDEEGMAEYQNEIAFIIENIYSNDPGGQEYTRTGFGDDYKWYRLLLTYEFNGTVKAYLNGNLIKEVQNESLANHHVILGVEGSARKNGDSIEAQFDNIKLKNWDNTPDWNAYPVPTNPGVTVDASQFDSARRVNIKGSMVGLTSNDDWDSAYNSVSGVCQFATY